MKNVRIVEDPSTPIVGEQSELSDIILPESNYEESYADDFDFDMD